MGLHAKAGVSTISDVDMLIGTCQWNSDCGFLRFLIHLSSVVVAFLMTKRLHAKCCY